MRSGTWAVLVVTGLAACNSAYDSAPSSGADVPGSNVAGAGSINGSPGSSGGAPALPPEREETASFRAPVVSGRWVWTANPDTGKVAVVDAKSFAVRLSDAGLGPTFLAALPSEAESSRALVINVGSEDATLLTATGNGPVTAVGPIALQSDANAWAVSNTGQFAIAWTDSHAITPDPTQGYQDISVLDLRVTPPLATRLSVGFLPSRVFIDQAETRAFVVASSGISVIELDSASGPRVSREWPVSADVKENTASRDVSIMPDGSFAFVRHEGSAVVTLLDLASGALSSVLLPGAVTDLDLVENAQSALAVVRGSEPLPPPGDAPDSIAASAGSSGASGEGGEGGEGGNRAEPLPVPETRSSLIILPIPSIFSAPGSFQTVTIAELFGQVVIAPRGSSALLYTNAVSNSHLTVLETAAGQSFLSNRTIDVRGDVADVFPSPDGAYAIATLRPKASGGKPGFAAVPIANALPARVQTTDAPVFAVAQSEAPGARAVVTVSDGKANFAAYIVRMPELVIDQVKLPSRPLPGATGLVPAAGVAYIAQEHPQGRITFINLETGIPRTITGFELSAKVTDGR